MLATATLAMPHVARTEASKRSRRELVPVVTTQIDSAIAFPPHLAYDELIREASSRFGVDAMLIKSVIQTESAFNALAVSRAGAQGLMQLMPQLSEELGLDDPFDARQNIMGGAQYLRRLLDRYRGNERLALAGYNAGITNVAEHGGVPPFRETRKYIRRVTSLLRQWRRQ
jgi:soluble lytic murein transglycosylase-like protein